MGVLRHDRNLESGSPGGGITVTCPKCQESIVIRGFSGDEPVRCGKCAYPMICREDLLLIVDACRKIDNADYVESAVKILRRLSDIIPEAGTALGALASMYTLPVSDNERWNRLISAYAGGDENAQEWLRRLCQSNPGVYGCRPCRICGAPRYYIKSQKDKTSCSYCQSTV